MEQSQVHWPTQRRFLFSFQYKCSAIVPAFVQESAVGTEQGKSQDKLITVGYGVLGIAAANWLALVGGSTWSAVVRRGEFTCTLNKLHLLTKSERDHLLFGLDF